RHELADEDNAAPLPPPDVKAQVDFGKVAEARPGHPQNARVEEVEGDETRQRRAATPIKLEPGREMRLEQRRRDLPGDDRQVRPARRQEGTANGLHWNDAHWGTMLTGERCSLENDAPGSAVLARNREVPRPLRSRGACRGRRARPS